MDDSMRRLHSALGPPPKSLDMVFSEGGQPTATPCIIPAGLTPSKIDPTSQNQTQIVAALVETLSTAALPSINHESASDPQAVASLLGDHFDGYITVPRVPEVVRLKPG
ncbi:Uncharacterized protein Adt_20940 [Abeliophyllum distichum]|uniref:Uncharacterized protein n=1 Tax=Abeliophyllum distichum TaxID=126358 RepID=A0ABD1SY13_9LAMI